MTVCVDLEAAIQEGRHTRQLADISSFVRKSKRIVVVTGAGISCSSGIPVSPFPPSHTSALADDITQDFRSSDGLYALAKEQYPTGVAKGSDLFDAALFRNAASTAAFFTFISCLKKTVDAAAPTPTHLFLSRLHEKGRLLRLYTQNIDGLEERAGLAAANPTNGGSARKDASAVTVQLHGDIHRLRCVLCSTDVAFTAEHIELYSAGQAPPCPNCTQRCETTPTSFPLLLTEISDSRGPYCTIRTSNANWYSASRNCSLQRTSPAWGIHRQHRGRRSSPEARYAHHHGNDTPSSWTQATCQEFC